MPEYLLVESHGPWNGPACERFANDALALVRSGNAVSLFLVEDGVTAALAGALPALAELRRDGGTVWVDEFSLRQRGLADAELDGERIALDAVAAKLLEPPVQVVWH
jgi:sulfur relay (sulfurtransferase) DsrF/TusC family protein